MNATKTECSVGDYFTVFLEPRSDGNSDLTIEVHEGTARELYEAFRSSGISIAVRMRDGLLESTPDMPFRFAEIIGDAVAIGVFDALGINPDGDVEDDD